MIDILKKIDENRGKCYVFHSEICASFWIKKAIDISAKKTIYKECYISWDQFKERYLAFAQGKIATDDAFRSMFLFNFLRKNHEKKIFKKIINPQFSGNYSGFLQNFKRTLITLDKIKQIPSHVLKKMDPDKKDDLFTIYKLYNEFLKENDLFEPYYNSPALNLKKNNFCFIFPEIIKDFSVAGEKLKRHDNITLFALHKTLPDLKPILIVFENTILEIKWTLLKISNLINQGIKPEHIILTVVDLEKIEPYLKQFARLYNVPLVFHMGKSIASYSIVSLFRQIKDCYEKDFSLNSLKVFLLNKAIPWQNESICRELIFFGTGYNCLKNYKHDNIKIDIWEKNLQRIDKSDYYYSLKNKLIQFYRSLKKEITKINKSEDFISLKKNIERFIQIFLKDLSVLKTDQYNYLTFAIDTLDDMIFAQQKTGFNFDNSTYTLWLQYMSNILYVARTSEKGITVYPYRVSAGILPQYHFIINASQQGTEYIVKQLPFLSIDEELLVNGAEMDLTSYFLFLYSLSGQNVYISFSKKGYFQTHLPPSFFINKGEIKEFKNIEQLENRDIYNSELSFWREKKDEHFDKIYPIQKQALLRALDSILLEKDTDYTKIAIEDRVLNENIKGNLPQRDNLLEISPTALELYNACAFGYLMLKVFDLGQFEYNPVMVNNLLLGNIIHAILRDFFKRNTDVNENFDPKKINSYFEFMKKSADKIFYQHELHSALPLLPIWQQLKNKIMDNLYAFVEIEVQEFPYFRLVDTEKAIKLNLKDPELVLYGKIDRISCCGQRYAVIEYKKKNHPSKGEIFNRNGEVQSFQIPFYVYLFLTKERQPSIVSYYSLENKKYTHILHDEKSSAQATWQEMAGAIENIQGKIQDMYRGIEQGNYTINLDYNFNGCDRCDFRGLCRIKYLLG